MNITLRVGEQTVLLDRVAFEDIKLGDTVAHMHESNGIRNLWVGVAGEKGKQGDVWYGDGRLHAEETRPDEWSDFTDNPSKGIPIVYGWHDDPAKGHTIWLCRMVK